MAFAYLIENASDISQRLVFNTLAKLEHSCGMAEAAARTKIADSQWPFQHKRAAHQLTPDSHKALVRKRALIGLGNPRKNLFFTVRCVNLSARFVFQLPYLYDNARTLIEQLHKLMVKLVNPIPQFFKRHKSNTNTTRKK
jgi:hypothetical protein